MKIRILSFALASALTIPAIGQVPVRVASATTESLQQRQAVTGSLRAVARGDVAALEAGRLVELTVREGDHVNKGDAIAKVDARRLEAQKGELEAERSVAEAELLSHQANAVKAAADLVRAEKLTRQNAISQQEHDAMRANERVATANIEAARRRINRITQSIRLIDVRLSDTVIRAPYDASVVVRHVEPGDWVQPGEALLTLVSTGPIEAWLEVPERFAQAIVTHGDTVVVRSRALDEELLVLSTKRVADVNPRVRTMSFVVTLDNSAGLLAAGMSVEGWIAAGPKQNVLTVPKDAVVRRAGQPFVFAIDNAHAQATAMKMPVRILFETPNRIAIAGTELAAGSNVIVEGNERLMPGQAVVQTQTADPPTVAATPPGRNQDS